MFVCLMGASLLMRELTPLWTEATGIRALLGVLQEPTDAMLDARKLSADHRNAMVNLLQGPSRTVPLFGYAARGNTGRTYNFSGPEGGYTKRDIDVAFALALIQRVATARNDAAHAGSHMAEEEETLNPKP